MTLIKSVADLETLLKTLNRQGVTKFQAEGLLIELEPERPRRRLRRSTEASDPADPYQGMSEEDIATYSSESLPEDV